MSGKKNQGFKQKPSNYFDIFLSIINFLIVVIILIFYSGNIFISVISVIISNVLIVLIIYTFIRNNPFHWY